MSAVLGVIITIRLLHVQNSRIRLREAYGVLCEVRIDCIYVMYINLSPKAAHSICCLKRHDLKKKKGIEREMCVLIFSAALNLF